MSKLDILFIKDDGQWVAQCLQYDIAAQGDTIPDAKSALEYAIATELSFLFETNRAIDELPSAPKCYWDKYENGSELQPISQKPMRLFPAKLSEFIHGVLPVNEGLRVA